MSTRSALARVERPLEGIDPIQGIRATPQPRPAIGGFAEPRAGQREGAGGRDTDTHPGGLIVEKLRQRSTRAEHQLRHGDGRALQPQ